MISLVSTSDSVKKFGKLRKGVQIYTSLTDGEHRHENSSRHRQSDGQSGHPKLQKQTIPIEPHTHTHTHTHALTRTQLHVDHCVGVYPHNNEQGQRHVKVLVRPRPVMQNFFIQIIFSFLSRPRDVAEQLVHCPSVGELKHRHCSLSPTSGFHLIVRRWFRYLSRHVLSQPKWARQRRQQNHNHTWEDETTAKKGLSQICCSRKRYHQGIFETAPVWSQQLTFSARKLSSSFAVWWIPLFFCANKQRTPRRIHTQLWNKKIMSSEKNESMVSHQIARYPNSIVWKISPKNRFSHPMKANARSSNGSNGNSRRRLVLNKAVSVSVNDMHKIYARCWHLWPRHFRKRKGLDVKSAKQNRRVLYLRLWRRPPEIGKQKHRKLQRRILSSNFAPQSTSPLLLCWTKHLQIPPTWVTQTAASRDS